MVDALLKMLAADPAEVERALRRSHTLLRMLQQRAREIARRGLYRRRDGLPPSVNNVCARASAYPGLFVRDGGVILLRRGTTDGQAEDEDSRSWGQEGPN